jgi:hypothetical protein
MCDNNALRTLPMIWWKNPTSTFPSGPYCAACGRPIRGAAKFAVHVIGGGSVVLHPGDEAAYVPEGGDVGWHDVGSECAKKFGEFASKVPA